MNAATLLRLLPHMNVGVHQISGLSRISAIAETAVFELLNELAANGVGEASASEVRFESEDKLRAALTGITLGCSPVEVSRSLHWRDFESFAKEVFERNGFSVEMDVRLKRPRVQIDVLASRASSAVCVDCKHWGSAKGASALRDVAAHQLLRTKALMKSQQSSRLNIREAMPVVITLREEPQTIVERVPIVPINRLQDFVLNIEGIREQAVIIRGIRQTS